MTEQKSIDYWRDLVASAAEVKHAIVTPFSPSGFYEAIGGNEWFYIALGPLALCHDEEWVFREHEETLEERMRYAYRGAKEALAALRALVTPNEPECAKIIEKFYLNNRLERSCP